MMTRLQTLSMFASVCFIASSGSAATPQNESPVQKIETNRQEQLQKSHQQQLRDASNEYEARLAEFQSGRTPANLLLKVNRRLLLASLETGVPNAAVEYDRRALEIEEIAQTNFDLRTATKQDVTQAKLSRLDAILKDLLVVPDSGKN